MRVDELLAALPPLPDLDPANPRAAELLLAKQLAACCRELVAELLCAADSGELSPADRQRLAGNLMPGRIEAVLGPLGREGLYFEDTAWPELAKVRTRLGEVDARLEELWAGVQAELKSKHGLDFGWREFLVVEEPRARALPASLATLEPCDSRHVLVRPALPPEATALAAERRRLVAEERRIETGLVRKLAPAIAAEVERLTRAVEALRKMLNSTSAKSDSEAP